MAAEPSIAGSCDLRFERVRQAFRDNFPVHDEIGAAVCLRIGGRVVVDLWGGHRDAARTHPWDRDTLVNAYSVGKGVTAIGILALVERGLLALDTPVTELWPEYGREDKGATTLRMMLSHRAGQPGVRAPLPADAMLDWNQMAAALAAQRPFWPPGEDHGYHVNSYGFLVGELARRKLSRSIGELLREIVTGPIGADYHIGLPASEHARVADWCGPGANTMPDASLLEQGLGATGDDERAAMRRAAYMNPLGLSGMGVVNTPGWRSAQIPSTNGHGTARGVAAVYGAFLDGSLVGEGLGAEATSTQSEGTDRLLERPSRFGLGFQLWQETRPIGPNPRSFGHFGYGGALGFADPDADLAFGYVMNRPGERWQTPRVEALVGAVYESIGAA